MHHKSDSSNDTDTSEPTQENSKDERRESIKTPIKLPGRKLDAPPKKPRPLAPTEIASASPHHKGLLPPQVLGRKVLTGGTDEKLHKRRCYEYQRTRTRKAAAPVVHRLKNRNFLKAVDRHRYVNRIP